MPALKENGRANSNTTSRSFLFLAHWLLISLLLVSSWSGGLLALDQRPWLKVYFSWWPGLRQVPFAHLLAASGWLALALAYAFVRLRRQHSAGEGMHKAAHAHARVTRYLRWLAGSLLLSGAVMLLGLWPVATRVLHDLHAALAMALLAFVLWHLVVEWRLGALPRVRHLFLPKKFPALGRSVALLLFSVLGIGAGVVYWQAAQEIIVPRFAGEMQIDGADAEAAWRSAPSHIISTYYGAPYQRSVPVEIKMLHDGYSLYLHAKWPDPSKSMQHLPLIKTANGWQVKQSSLLANDEQEFYEDKFAVMLAQEPWAALRSVFLAPKQGRGGHMTRDQQIVDVWHWKSVRNHHFGNLDDAFFGPQLPQLPGMRRNTWGYASDPLFAGGYKENWTWFDPSGVIPLRLPRKLSNLQAFQAPCGNACPPFALDWHDSQPYTRELDTLPIGTILPSVVWIHPNEGDRADVRAAGVWRDGYWHLELARSLETTAKQGANSDFDLKISSGMYMWFATFDHSQIRHTYHWRPLRLQLAP